MYRVRYEPSSDKLINDDGAIVAEVINRAFVPTFAYAPDLRVALRRLVEAVNKGEPVLDALMTADRILRDSAPYQMLPSGREEGRHD